MSTEVTRIAVSGDWHGAYSYARKALWRAYLQGAEHILHVGDFGFWGQDDPGYLGVLSEKAVEYDLPILFIDGNHEDHDALDALPVREDGLREVAPYIYHVPRGHRWEWGGITFVGLGGAPSIGREESIRGFDWFPQEVISTGDAYRTVAGGHADVMVTHDCPSGINIPGMELIGQETALGRDLYQHREMLQAVVEAVTPQFLFHGHYHRNYSEVMALPGGGECRVTGLDMNANAFHQSLIPWNTQVIDLSELEDGPWVPDWNQ